MICSSFDFEVKKLRADDDFKVKIFANISLAGVCILFAKLSKKCHPDRNNLAIYIYICTS